MLKHVIVNQKSAVFIHPGSVYVDKVKLLFLQEELSQALWSAAQLVWNFPGYKVLDLFTSGKTVRQQRQEEKKQILAHLFSNC